MSNIDSGIDSGNVKLRFEDESKINGEYVILLLHTCTVLQTSDRYDRKSKHPQPAVPVRIYYQGTFITLPTL